MRFSTWEGSGYGFICSVCDKYCEYSHCCDTPKSEPVIKIKSKEEEEIEKRAERIRAFKNSEMLRDDYGKNEIIESDKIFEDKK